MTITRIARIVTIAIALLAVTSAISHRAWAQLPTVCKIGNVICEEDVPGDDNSQRNEQQ